jgi:hypothetical protein
MHRDREPNLRLLREPAVRANLLSIIGGLAASLQGRFRFAQLFSADASLSALLMVLILAASPVSALPSRLTEEPVSSPDKAHRASVEWEDVGYMGLLRMRVFDRTGNPKSIVEVPQLKPEPISLIWLNNDWVGSETFVGERGGGFFYVNAPEGRGFLLEILEPRPNADWLFTLTSSEAQSSRPITMLSRGTSSLFPIVMREAPRSQSEYLSVPFVEQLANSLNAYREFRRVNKVQSIDALTGADIRPGRGAIFLARVDDHSEVIYFPLSPATTSEVLARVQRHTVTPEAQKQIDSAERSELRVRWLEGDEFEIDLQPLAGGPNTTSGTVLMRGRFPGASDVPPDAETTATAAPEGEKQTPTPRPTSRAEDAKAARTPERAQATPRQPTKSPAASDAVKKTPTPRPASTGPRRTAGDLKRP